MSNEPVIPENATISDVVKKYVELRDELRVFQKSVAEKEEAMKGDLDILSMWLRDRADELDVDSFKTSEGTAYRATKEKYRIDDWDLFITFVKKTDNFQLLEKRVAKNAAREIHKEDGIVPPGLSYLQEIEFNVLRPKKPKTGEINDDTE